MKPTISPNALDTIKKLLGGTMVLAALGLELFAPAHAAASATLACIGSLLLGLGMQSSRGRSAVAVLTAALGVQRARDAISSPAEPSHPTPPELPSAKRRKH
jgi:hypothetical protein